MPSTINASNSLFGNANPVLAEISSGVTNIQSDGYVIASSTGTNAIYLGGSLDFSNHTVNIDGTVMSFGTNSSFGDGVFVGVIATADINVGVSGILYGHFNAIDAFGQADLSNSGSISSNSFDPTIRFGDSGGSSNWDNFTFNSETGRIANSQGVAIAYDAAGTHELVNDGIISAGAGFFTIWGVNDSVEKITNTGVFTSGVTLGDGDDVVNTRFGCIDGFSELGSGNDRYIGSNTAVDTVFGNDGNDFLSGFGGNDVLNGGTGNDKLTGGAGADTMTSGSGFNTFIFSALSDSTVAAAGRDKITDFSSPSDNFDISGIDANSVLAGNNAFTAFIGAAAFTGLGQIRAVQVGVNTLVQFNTTGSTAADMAILLENVTATNVNLSDFIL